MGIEHTQLVIAANPSNPCKVNCKVVHIPSNQSDPTTGSIPTIPCVLVFLHLLQGQGNLYILVRRPF